MANPRIYMSPPHMSGKEQERVAEVFASNWIAPVGPHLTEFEKRFAEQVGVEHAAAVASGTAALHLALRRLDLAPGSEVICSTFTFCASANPILYEQARPVFIDADPQTWNMDPHLLEDELRSAAAKGTLPRAILVVDLLGQTADMDVINSLAQQYELPVIEDAAEALGATYKGRPAGSLGWASAFSFNGNKIITTSGGGMLCSNDGELIAKARHWATQAKDAGHLYYHSEMGYNYRMSNVLAAIGLAQLEVLPERVAARKRIFEFYRDHFAAIPGITMMPLADYGESNYWLSVVQIDAAQFGADCEQVRLALEADNIESRRVWVPLHQLPIYQNCRHVGGTVSETIFDNSLCLPSGSALTEEDLQRVVAVIDGVRKAGG
ncbi:MAG: aminotransferase class I/II-fold pyridoxal phosphate-dependent enzyme [Planctomycetales bacterium]|nr:aminotransferase class I/II-fold pyridoxal phosphate-dependent enzyme [Planctomycetales bacterium]